MIGDYDFDNEGIDRTFNVNVCRIMTVANEILMRELINKGASEKSIAWARKQYEVWDKVWDILARKQVI